MKNLLLITTIIGTSLTVTAQVTNYGTGSGTIGSGSSFFGKNAGGQNTGPGNVAIGDYSLEFNESAANVGVGAYTLRNNKGNDNTAVGHSALRNNDSGGGNTAFGTNALYTNNSGANNVAIGGMSLNKNFDGSGNLAIGYSTLRNNVSGDNNIGIGKGALYYNLANENTAIGVNALNKNNTGAGNLAIGYNALQLNEGGANNVGIGYSALRLNINGHNNVAIGYQADVTVDGLTNATAIGYKAKVATNNSMALGGTGANAVKVGIGTDSPTEVLDVVGNVKAIKFIGDGSELTNIDAANINGSFVGDGAGLTNIQAANIVGGIWTKDGNTISYTGESSSPEAHVTIGDENEGNVKIYSKDDDAYLSLRSNTDKTGIIFSNNNTSFDDISMVGLRKEGDDTLVLFGWGEDLGENLAYNGTANLMVNGKVTCNQIDASTGGIGSSFYSIGCNRSTPDGDLSFPDIYKEGGGPLVIGGNVSGGGTIAFSGGLSIGGKNPISSVNGFNNMIEFKDHSNAAIVFHPGETNELMFGFHENGNFYWGTGQNNTSNPNENRYAMFLDASTSALGLRGKLTCNEVEVKVGGWSDFVFENDYALPSLIEVENYIAENGHLKDIPSAAEVDENGINLGAMDANLLQKIEELTLYTIAQEKELTSQTKELAELRAIVESILEVKEN